MFTSLSREDILPCNSSVASGNGKYWTAYDYPAVWDAMLYQSSSSYVISTNEPAPNNVYARSSTASTSTAWVWVSPTNKVVYSRPYAKVDMDLFADKQLKRKLDIVPVVVSKLRSENEAMTTFADFDNEWDKVLPLVSSINGAVPLTKSLKIGLSSPVTGLYAPYMVKVSTNYVARKDGVYSFAARLRTGAAAINVNGVGSAIDTSTLKGNTSSNYTYKICEISLRKGIYPLTYFYRAVVKNNEYTECTIYVQPPGDATYYELSFNDCMGGLL